MRTKPPKPSAPTILKRSTARTLHYLESRGLIAPITSRNLVVAHDHYRSRITGTMERITDKSPTCGV